MIENDESGALEPFDFDHLIDNVPKIKRLDYDIDNVQFEVPLDSSAMTPPLGGNREGYRRKLRQLRWLRCASRHRYHGLYRFRLEFHDGESPQTGGDHRQPAADRRGAYRRRGESDNRFAGGCRQEMPTGVRWCRRSRFCSRTICGAATAPQSTVPTTSTRSRVPIIRVLPR